MNPKSPRSRIPRKLQLSRETLRRLEAHELQAVHGGATFGATGPCLTCPQCVVTLEEC